MFAPHILYVVLFFAHNPFVVDCTFSATPAEWLQQYQMINACVVIKFMHLLSGYTAFKNSKSNIFEVSD